VGLSFGEEAGLTQSIGAHLAVLSAPKHWRAMAVGGPFSSGAVTRRGPFVLRSDLRAFPPEPTALGSPPHRRGGVSVVWVRERQEWKLFAGSPAQRLGLKRAQKAARVEG
jgi:hypothetical protein